MTYYPQHGNTLATSSYFAPKPKTDWLGVFDILLKLGILFSLLPIATYFAVALWAVVKAAG